MNKRKAMKLLRECAAEAVCRYEDKLFKRGADANVGMIWFGLLQRMHAALVVLGEPIQMHSNANGWAQATKVERAAQEGNK